MIFNPGDLVFDIGAHYGESIDKFQRHFGAGLVVSVEPCRESYAKLLASIDREKYKAHAIHAAVGQSAGLTMLRRAANQDGLSVVQTMHQQWSSIYPDAGYEDPQPVAVITVDMLQDFFGDPAYVKIDTEGCELDVLMGMARCRPPAITFEFHRQHKEDAMTALRVVASRGYSLATLIEDDVDPTKRPDIGIYDFIDGFDRSTPQWGNITVCR